MSIEAHPVLGEVNLTISPEELVAARQQALDLSKGVADGDRFAGWSTSLIARPDGSSETVFETFPGYEHQRVGIIESQGDVAVTILKEWNRKGVGWNDKQEVTCKLESNRATVSGMHQAKPSSPSQLLVSELELEGYLEPTTWREGLGKIAGSRMAHRRAHRFNLGNLLLRSAA